MTNVTRLLSLGAVGGREPAESFPTRLLEELVTGSQARGARVGLGGRILAAVGSLDQPTRHYELPYGRDTFWLEFAGGVELDEEARSASGALLSGWVVREELKKARFSERRRLWEVESLRAIAEALGGTLEPRRIAEELLLHATALLDARRGEVWLVDGDRFGPVARMSGAQATTLCDDGTCTVAARIGGPVMERGEAAALREEGLLEVERLAVPINARRGRIGVVALAEREVRGGTAPFSGTDTETLSLFAAQAAVALENAVLYREGLDRERLERELELAASIQRQLLPSVFRVPRAFQLSARTAPSRHVGGDVYDVIPAGDASVVMVADVSGKGVPAALMASSLHAAAHILAPSKLSLAELTTRLHAHLLSATPENKFATVFLARLEPDGSFEYVSAGHNPALVIEPDGSWRWLGATGTPLGLLRDATYHSERVTLAPGAVTVIYTDGLTEASDQHEEEFGMERLGEVARQYRDGSLAELLDALFARVDVFTGGAPPHDDRTALAIRRIALS